MTWLLVVLGGGVGALLRAEISARVAGPGRSGRAATTEVNVIGAFLLGLLIATGDGHDLAVRALGTGFLGGFTTFSTWMVESLGDLRETWLRSVAAPLVAGLAAVSLGLWVGGLG